MFEKIYKRRFDITRHENGPLAEERKAFLQKFDEHERPSQNRLVIVACYLLLITETLRLAERGDEKIGLKEIKEQAALWSTRKSNRFKNGPYSDSARQRFIRWGVRFLEFRGRFEPLHVPSTPYDDWLHQYETFLREERELVESTIDARCRDVRRFLHRLDVSPQDFASVTVDRIQRTLIGQLEEANWKRNTIQGFVAALRGFFRYAERNKWAPPRLAESIDSPRVYQHESIPIGPSWEQVRQVIATTDGEGRSNHRDRAILLLLAVYGFRAGEVARLTLDSINWHDEVLTLTRGRNGVTQLFPLCRPVGTAIAEYLSEERASSIHRSLFLQYWRPLPLSSHSVTRIALKRLTAANIKLQRPGAHAFRHACASHLLQQGLTMKEIGDHLGHQYPDSTRIYAKVNLPQLRQVANLELGDVL
ncbi:tyrosine-type recombinase/integrase [Fuerstiella marisgermanici]|uniref:Tyrosine recombinase XerD n=1 Tax=Fuerstiella marisgermanici TaxID=1891926 RepID=A0A1P8WQL9_9PLAN|nr:tyrosine-type recombinase/integrase [Fuerstiella marisgermanici]APZ96355.1 Tyrosine recombinase XerD [Fuerstiella marisgermanici]